jgi:hypothetical protein
MWRKRPDANKRLEKPCDQACNLLDRSADRQRTRNLCCNGVWHYSWRDLLDGNFTRTKEALQ